MATFNAERNAFGRRLKSARESRGILLRQIADSTKIKESLLADLECGDVSKWPEGIYRRAYLCSYLSAIGVAAQPTLADFARLFPDETLQDECKPPLPQPEAVNTSNDEQPSRSMSNRAWIAAFDVTAVVLLSTLIAAIAGVGVRAVLAYAAIAYAAAGSLVCGETFGAYVHHRISALIDARRPAITELPRTTQITRLVVARQTHATRRLIDTDFEEEASSQRASA